MRQNVEVMPESVSDAPPRRPSLRERVFGRERPRPPERTEDREDDEESEKRLREATRTPERRETSRPAERTVDNPDHFEPATIAKRTVVSGLVTGGALATGAALLAATGGAGAPVIVPAMIKAGIGGAIAGGSTYIGGETHNLLWKKKGQQRPGPIGTFVRGMFSGITVPAGLVYRLIKGKDEEPTPASQAA